jgi:hypothetical protein
VGLVEVGGGRVAPVLLALQNVCFAHSLPYAPSTNIAWPAKARYQWDTLEGSAHIAMIQASMMVSHIEINQK